MHTQNLGAQKLAIQRRTWYDCLFTLSIATICLHLLLYDIFVSGEPRLAFSFKDIGKKPGHFFPTSLDIDNNGILYTVSYKTGEIWAIDPIAGKAHVVAELPTGGTIALKFAAGSGDLYVTVAKRIIDVTKRNVIGHQNPGTSLYQIRGIGRTFEFPRLRV